MTFRLKKLLFILFALSQPSLVLADQILVIANKQTLVSKLNQKRLADIYKRKVLINEEGKRWLPLNMGSDHPLRRAFSKKLFNRLPEQMESYWNIQYFKGITPPYTVFSEEAMLEFVINTPGAIGYILPCHLNSKVQVILKLSVKMPLHPGCDQAP